MLGQVEVTLITAGFFGTFGFGLGRLSSLMENRFGTVWVHQLAKGISVICYGIGVLGLIRVCTLFVQAGE